MNSKLFIAGAMIAFAMTNVNADQIDNETHEATAKAEAVMVKVNPTTQTVELFKVTSPEAREIVAGMDKLTAEAKEQAMARVSEMSAVESNKVGEMTVAQSELDKEGSTPAWCGRWWGGYRWYGWGGYYAGYNWYRPYYNAGYIGCGGYNYYYGYNYRWNNCYYGWYY